MMISTHGMLETLYNIKSTWDHLKIIRDQIFQFALFSVRLLALVYVVLQLPGVQTATVAGRHSHGLCEIRQLLRQIQFHCWAF